MKIDKILEKISQKYEIKSFDLDLSEVEIDNVFLDSRMVQKNGAFFALKGKNVDGANFIESAIENGAILVVAQEFIENEGIISIKTDNVQGFLSEFLQAFYPNLPKNIYGITGTNGKSSVAEFTRQILGFLGKKSASIGTIGVLSDDENIKNQIEKSSLTTPDIINFYKNLAILKQNNVNDVAIEASSIGLDQKRIDGIKIDNAAFTNFSQDHLDYHKNMDDYFAAKTLLFSEVLSENGNAILNSDIKEFTKISEICKKRGAAILDYGFEAGFIKIIEIKHENDGQNVKITINDKKYEFFSKILAKFQIYNILCALGLVLGKYKLNEEEISDLLLHFKDLKSAEGRMEKVCEFNGAKIFIDFAHSPDALENVLKNAQNMEKKRLIVMFGCGGDRDSSKRPKMGKIACKYADLAVVTDDNPRKENPEAIRREILQACNMKKTLEIGGRKNAIEKILQMSEEGDIIILAGKGHEKYQILGDEKIEFDEKKIIEEFIKK